MNDYSYNETSFDHKKGDNYWGISTGEQRWVNKIEKYAQSHPEEVTIISRNNDGSIFAHVPEKWVKLSPPKEVSEEQRQAASERFKKMHEDKKQSS